MLPSVSELVPETHQMHGILCLVQDHFDLRPTFQSYRAGAGQPPYHPGMMAALMMLSFCEEIRSPREIERACVDRLSFMAITDRQKPDFRTISRFRKCHIKYLEGMFNEVLTLCREMGMASLGHVALDGTKTKANASKHKAMSYGRMEAKQAELRASVREWFEQADRADEAGDALYGDSLGDGEMPDWVKEKIQRANRIEEASTRLEARAAERAASAAPCAEEGGNDGDGPLRPSRRTASSGTSPTPRARFSRPRMDLYRATTRRRRRTSSTRSSSARDCRQRQRHEPAGVDGGGNRAGNGKGPKELSVDAGYCSEANLEYLVNRGINGYVATGRQRHDSPSATGSGPPSKGRRRAAMARKLRRGDRRRRYRHRKTTIEPVFGQIKQGRGFRRFHLRGRENVELHWGIMCTAHNIGKLWKYVLARGGLAALKWYLKARKAGESCGRGAPSYPDSAVSWTDRLLSRIRWLIGGFPVRIGFAVPCWRRSARFHSVRAD